MMEEESKTLDIEGPFKVSGDYFKEDNLYIDEIDLNELKVNGFTVNEMSKCFKRWLLFNQEKFLKDFDNPNCRVQLNGNEFSLRFTDTYTYKIVLEQVEKQKDGESQE